MRVRWTPQARRDLIGQLKYVALDKPSAADRMAGLIQTAMTLLSDYREMGKTGMVAGTREYVVPQTPFVLIYRLDLSEMVVLRLLHGAQQR